jgi:glycosyltransferase involved in cell wall biosynthesis
MKTVSVIVPCRNEVRHIDAFLESVLAQELPPYHSLQLVIADGMSDDGTRERLAVWRIRRSEVEVIDNPDRITSAALNVAIARAAGEVIVRMDVHTTYEPDYVKQCVRVLEETKATCVGGPWRPVGDEGLQRAIAMAFQSRFGSGGAASRRLDYSGPADTVYLGAWRREDLVRLGGFDEQLIRNQDDELNLRIWRSGGSVWQSASIRSSYAPRASLLALFRQFFQYGYWKVPVILKHRIPASPRHLLPFGFVAAVGVLTLLAPFSSLAAIALLSLLALYGLAVVSSAAALRPRASFLGIALALGCMHVGYGVGFGRGLLDFVVFRRGGHESMARLTR